MEGRGNLINLTPHDITIINNLDYEQIVIKSSGCLRLVACEQTPLTPLLCDGQSIHVVEPPRYKGVGPAQIIPSEAASIIVSSVVAEYMYLYPRRYKHLHIYVPDTGPDSVHRDSSGRIIGVSRLIRY